MINSFDEVKLGDVVELYIDSSGYITDNYSDKTIIATIIGKSISQGILFGFTDKKRPKNSYRRNGIKDDQISYWNNDYHDEFTYSLLSLYPQMISSIVTTNQPKVISRSTQIFDISDWKAWAHNIPGECKCGIRKKDCDYHR